MPTPLSMQLVDNLKYNIEINSNVEMDGGRLNATKDISKCTTAAYLNWHEIDQPGFDQVLLHVGTQHSPPRTDAWLVVWPPQPELELADIMLGSELTYMEKNVDPLIRVVKKYLKPDGVFYHVLSDDRTVRSPHNASSCHRHRQPWHPVPCSA
jgi:hypothetical protein